MTTPPVPDLPAGHVGPVMVPPDSVPPLAGVTAFLSHVRREGTWVLPRVLRVASMMGQVDLDLTHVQLAPGESVIDVRAVMAQINVIVPHELRLECDGAPFMGEFKIKRQSDAIPSPDAPVVRIKGLAFVASVKVRIVDTAAPTWFDAWLERRRARRARRLGG